MKTLLLLGLLAFTAGTCQAENLTIPKDTVLRSDRSLISLKAGTVVDVVSKTDTLITVRYNGQTGTIKVSSLAAAPSPATPSKPVAAAAAPTPPRKSVLAVDAPQSTYGNLVKKAETNAAKHENNLVRPADDVMDPSK